ARTFEEFLKGIYSGGIQWRDKRARELGDVRVVIISSAGGSNGFPRLERRSRERRGNSISIIMHYGATGLIMCRQRREPHTLQAPVRPKISSKQSSRTSLSRWSTIT